MTESFEFHDERSMEDWYDYIYFLIDRLFISLVLANNMLQITRHNISFFCFNFTFVLLHFTLPSSIKHFIYNGVKLNDIYY